MLFYHGSPYPDIDRFEHGHTAYGIFFTPDRDTAAYYATGRTATLYAVHLRIQNLADLDDPAIFERIMREAIDFTFTRKEEDALAFAARLYHEWYEKNDEVRAWFNQQEGIEAVGKDGYSIEDLIWDNALDASDVDDLVKSIGLAHVTDAYNEAAPEYSEELNQVREAYGSQDFYLNYQDDFMRAAQHLGYDGVALTDPSSTGASVSYVVFNPEQIELVKIEQLSEKPHSTSIPR